MIPLHNYKYYKNNSLPELYLVNEEENSYLQIGPISNTIFKVHRYWKQFYKNNIEKEQEHSISLLTEITKQDFLETLHILLLQKGQYEIELRNKIFKN